MCPTFPSIIGFGNQAVFILNIIIILVFGYLGGFRCKLTWPVILYGGYFIGIACWDVLLEILRNKIGPTDFLEILRPIGFLLCYLFYRYSSLSIDIVEAITEKMIYCTFLIICCYCILEFIFPEPIRNISYFLWKRREVTILNNKAIGPFFQTYNSAYALLVPLFWSFISMFRMPRIKNILFFVLLLLTLLLTQSRSMYVCAGIGLCVCVLLATNFRSVRSLRRTGIIFGILGFIILYIFITYETDLRANLAYAFQGLEAMSEGNSTSLSTRQAQVDWAIDNNNISIIGYGIGKGEILLESIYALYYYRYGVLGLLIFFGLTLYTGFISLWISKRITNNIQYFYQALTVFFFLNPIALSSSCHQDMPKTCLIFYGMVGLVFYRYSVLKGREKRKRVKMMYYRV